MTKSYDAIVIGSGFGGSVAALRLAEKGYRVAVCEQGRNITPQDMEAAAKQVRKLLWMPKLGMRGYFSCTVYRHTAVLGGVGVGGGSLVFGGVLLRPSAACYQDTAWQESAPDWKEKLSPHFDTAERMLGLTTNPDFGVQDQYLKQTAEKLGCGESFSNVPSAIYYGEAGQEDPDPFFDRQGPARTGCTRCVECLSGCRYGAKNSLDKNYLYLTQTQGATLHTEQRIRAIRRHNEGHYTVETQSGKQLSAPKVVLACGVQGTIELLFRCRDHLKTLPHISQQLGHHIRTNSESIPVVLDQDPDTDLTEGASISSHFYFGDKTHIIQNRFPPAYDFMRWQLGPLIAEPSPAKRAAMTLATLLRHPLRSTAALRAKNFTKRCTALTVMQQSDNALRFRYGRGLCTAYAKGLHTEVVQSVDAPSYIQEAMEAAQAYAEVSGGIPLDYVSSTLLNAPATGHIMGGAIVGSAVETGVVNQQGEVHGYPGLYIADGSIIPANLGVNPSLTITALAEHIMAGIQPLH